MSGGILLGGDNTVRAPSNLLLPGYEYIVGRCLVPGCGATFREGEEAAWEKHVGQCARSNLDAIREVIAAKEKGPFADFDPEVSAHLRRVGERMLREGRLTIRPNEAAGHS